MPPYSRKKGASAPRRARPAYREPAPVACRSRPSLRFPWRWRRRSQDLGRRFVFAPRPASSPLLGVGGGPDGTRGGRGPCRPMVGAGSAQRARHSLGQWIRETRAAGKAPGLSPPRDGTTTLGAREGSQHRTFLSLPHHRHTPALLLSVWTSEVRLCLERRVCRSPGTGRSALVPAFLPPVTLQLCPHPGHGLRCALRTRSASVT